MNTPRWPLDFARGKQVCFLILVFLLSAALTVAILCGVYRVTQLPSSSLEVRRTNEAVVPVFRFVASSRGKYYYPLLSERGQELSVKNRLYFMTEEEAQTAGFVRWEPD